jgi:hypothetical protein
MDITSRMVSASKVGACDKVFLLQLEDGTGRVATDFDKLVEDPLVDFV